MLSQKSIHTRLQILVNHRRHFVEISAAMRRPTSLLIGKTSGRDQNHAYSVVSRGGRSVAAVAKNRALMLNWNHGRIVEPPRTFLARVGGTNMSQELGG
jgi:hypothetical protein